MPLFSKYPLFYDLATIFFTIGVFVIVAYFMGYIDVVKLIAADNSRLLELITSNLGIALTLSVGAGFFEELLFRLMLAGGLIKILANKVQEKKTIYISALVSSLAFSGIHFIGEYGKPMIAWVFAWLLAAGLIFFRIYRTQGFAIAAWTHCLFDLILMCVAIAMIHLT